jgi:hypothetical protein
MAGIAQELSNRPPGVDRGVGERRGYHDQGCGSVLGQMSFWTARVRPRRWDKEWWTSRAYECWDKRAVAGRAAAEVAAH